jgi:hypothetical protein
VRLLEHTLRPQAVCAPSPEGPSTPTRARPTLSSAQDTQHLWIFDRSLSPVGPSDLPPGLSGHRDEDAPPPAPRSRAAAGGRVSQRSGERPPKDSTRRAPLHLEDLAAAAPLARDHRRRESHQPHAPRQRNVKRWPVGRWCCAGSRPGSSQRASALAGFAERARDRQFGLVAANEDPAWSSSEPPGSFQQRAGHSPAKLVGAIADTREMFEGEGRT